jgi:hypothetical protein
MAESERKGSGKMTNRLIVKTKTIKLSNEERKKRRERILEALLKDKTIYQPA